MSLINKMLQDLDARGGATGVKLDQQELKAVPSVDKDRRPVWMVVAAVLGVALLAGGGWAGWRYWQSRAAPVAPAGPAPQIIALPPRPAMPVEPVAKPAVAASSAAAALPASGAQSAVGASSTAGAQASKAGSSASSMQAPVASNTPATANAHPAQASAGEAPTLPAPLSVAGARASSHAAHPASANADAELAQQETGLAAKAAPTPRQKAARRTAGPVTLDVESSRHELGPEQLSENTYRRALVSLQEGRVSEALADLDRSLEINPRNEAARQTYISLLLENKRADDAIRQLRLALGIDPRQPGLAMVLARLQLERGGPALDTLMRTLPFADNSADYQAFVAGVLQREQRNAEAAEHYREALKLSPQNGIWWMGLGISLQADKQLPEAREAFTRARAARGLTPELQSFVDRKLEQLSH